MGLLDRPVFVFLGLRSPTSAVTPLERRCIRNWAEGRRALVELGVEFGTTSKLLRSVMHPGGTLFLVDPFSAGTPIINSPKRVARRQVRSAAGGTVRWIEQTSHEASRGWGEPLDFVFIDADHAHEAVRRDWEDWSPHVTSGGVVLFHDLDHEGPGRLFHRLFLESEVPGWRFVERVENLGVVRREQREPSERTVSRRWTGQGITESGASA